MNDIKQLIIYAVMSVGVILLLIQMSKSDQLNSSIIVITAILLVVVLPVVLAIKLAKREKEREHQQRSNSDNS